MAILIDGKIYRIVSDSHPEVLPYYGSTVKTLKKRFTNHKSPFNTSSSKQIMIFDDARIELVEELICETKEELRLREDWFVRNNPCCNERNPKYDKNVANKNAYLKTYYNLHKEEAKANQKVYRELHRDEINAKQKASRLQKMNS